jgi:hypothetical protein
MFPKKPSQEELETQELLNKYIKKCAEQQKEIEELDESLHIARVGRRDLTVYVKELKEELIDAYQKRGHMYSAGEKDWIINRINELKD